MDARYPGFGGEGGQDSDRWSVVGNWRWTVSPNMVNEVRGGATGGAVQFASRLSKEAYAPYNGFYLTTPIMTSPLSRTNANERDAPTYFLEDSVSWIRGKHALAIGGTFTQINLNYVNHYLAPNVSLGVDSNDPAEVAGMFASGNFPGASTTDRNNARSLYALLTGRVTQISGTSYLDGSTGKYVYLGDSTQLAHQRELGVYIQDSWRVRPDLTATFGVRYQLQLPFVPGNDFYSRPLDYANTFGYSGITASGNPNLFAPCGGTGYPACTGSLTQFTGYKAGDQSVPNRREQHRAQPGRGVAADHQQQRLAGEDPELRPGVPSGILHCLHPRGHAGDFGPLQLQPRRQCERHPQHEPRQPGLDHQPAAPALSQPVTTRAAVVPRIAELPHHRDDERQRERVLAADEDAVRPLDDGQLPAGPHEEHGG